MKRAYKYKLNPTFKQQQMLLQTFSCARFIYNWGLDRKINAYKENKQSLSYIDLAGELTQLKKTEGHLWLRDVPNECLQQSLRNMDSAFSNFFKHNNRFPKFKSKRKSKESAKYINNVHFDFNEWRVKIPKCGWVKLCENMTFDMSNVKIGTLTVSRDKCGDFWCSVVVDDKQELKPKAKVSSSTAVGIDLGIKDFAILSDGTKISNPKYYENALKRLAKLQRDFARTQKGSSRHERARIRVARKYRHITNMRLDFLHKLSTYLISSFDTICLEDLNV